MSDSPPVAPVTENEVNAIQIKIRQIDENKAASRENSYSVYFAWFMIFLYFLLFITVFCLMFIFFINIWNVNEKVNPLISEQVDPVEGKVDLISTLGPFITIQNWNGTTNDVLDASKQLYLAEGNNTDPVNLSIISSSSYVTGRIISIRNLGVAPINLSSSSIDLSQAVTIVGGNGFNEYMFVSPTKLITLFAI